MTAPATSTRPVAWPEPPGKERERQREDRHADREVDEEDPVPVERVGDDAAEQHAGGAAAREDEAEDAHRLRPLRRLDEQGHDQRQRDCRDDRAADPLHGAGGDELALRARKAAGERREREDRDPDQEQPTVSEEVAEAPAEEEEAAEREQVGVDHPRERLLREAEVVADRRERDVHDRPVEDDHQVPEAEDEECEPTGAGIGDGHRGILSALPQSVSRLGRREPSELIGRACLLPRLPTPVRAPQWGRLPSEGAD